MRSLIYINVYHVHVMSTVLLCTILILLINVEIMYIYVDLHFPWLTRNFGSQSSDDAMNNCIKIITKLHLAQNPIFDHFTSWSIIHWHAFIIFFIFFFWFFCSTLGYQVHFLDIMLDFLVKQISRPTTREKSSGLNIVSAKNPL